jgi:hypothetical protein
MQAAEGARRRGQKRRGGAPRRIRSRMAQQGVHRPGGGGGTRECTCRRRWIRPGASLLGGQKARGKRVGAEGGPRRAAKRRGRTSGHGAGAGAPSTATTVRTLHTDSKQCAQGRRYSARPARAGRPGKAQQAELGRPERGYALRVFGRPAAPRPAVRRGENRGRGGGAPAKARAPARVARSQARTTRARAGPKTSDKTRCEAGRTGAGGRVSNRAAAHRQPKRGEGRGGTYRFEAHSQLFVKDTARVGCGSKLAQGHPSASRARGAVQAPQAPARSALQIVCFEPNGDAVRGARACKGRGGESIHGTGRLGPRRGGSSGSRRGGPRGMP